MYVRLGEICDFQSGGTPSKNNQKFFGGDIPWITTVALNGSGIDGSDAVNWITEDAIKQSAAKIVPANSIMIGTRVGVGKVAINLVDMSTSQDVVSLIGIDGTRWCKEYLCKCLTGKSQYLNSQARGATIKGIKIDTLANLKIPEIPIEKQYEVSRIIDKTRIIIEQRKQELTNLDELMKARFVEMFGTYPANEKRWNVGTIRDVVTEVRYGSSRKAAEGMQGQYLYLRMNNITYSGELVLNDIKTIDVPEKELLKCSVQRGDVLFNRTNSKELVGKTCVYNRDEMMVLAGFIIRVRVNEKILPEILSTFLNTDFSKKMLYGMCKSAIGQANINAQEFQNIEIYIPHMKSQEQFVEFKKQIDKSKVAVQKALDETQLLFDSLMQEYFG